ncbi:MAG: hypothetical protein OEO82_13995 [Gammaproteobacteria bacterium]|nr:hypothetical protein [Gammaproteobacteria bacterium]
MYERAPQYWLLLGLLFCLVGTYLGLQIERLYLYLGLVVGAACCLWSFLIFMRRSLRRPDVDTDPGLDQTCELNYKPDNS